MSGSQWIMCIVEKIPISITQDADSSVQVKKRRRSGLRWGFFACALGFADKQVIWGFFHKMYKSHLTHSLKSSCPLLLQGSFLQFGAYALNILFVEIYNIFRIIVHFILLFYRRFSIFHIDNRYRAVWRYVTSPEVVFPAVNVIEKGPCRAAVCCY